MSYEQACMANPRYEYYTSLLETLVNYKYRNNGPLSNEKIQQSVSRVMAETEEEGRDAKRISNNVTMDDSSSFHNCTIPPSQGEITNVTSVHSTISPSHGDITSVTSERRIYLINEFNELTFQSKINNLEEDDAESDQNSDSKVATYTTNVNSPQMFSSTFSPQRSSQTQSVRFTSGPRKMSQE